MNHSIVIYNTLSRKKEIFEPLHSPFVGIYVCGPTVYGDPHLGHARPAITFDIVFRYLKYMGYKVRYVRNITDVGHLENDADEGEDKIAKKARLDQLEPMEIAQYYTNRYHQYMDMLNVERPSIEPRASGHIIEQIEMIQTILDAGYAYEKNGSVYFNVKKYNADYAYGKLSGRVLEDLLENTRTNLASQDEKENAADFALWKKAQPEHIMRWKSPWGLGFPGWHAECTAMACKYLGEQFDIHGGGLDLLFPHHESEIAQSNAAYKHDPCKYWMHNNMITINGQKMGKSLGNFITLEEVFNGNHAALTQAYSPMTVRFFILQAQYRGTLDFSNEALQAAEKGLKRLFAMPQTLAKVKPAVTSVFNMEDFKSKAYEALNDDFNTPILISILFDIVRVVNSAKDGLDDLTSQNISEIQKIYDTFVVEILGLKHEIANESTHLIGGLMDMVLASRQGAKDRKDYATSDQIRDQLNQLNITIKDGKDGASWELN